MSALLVPCTACARHIRASEAACPFCRDGMPDRARLPAVAVRANGARLSRGALFLAGMTAVAGCGKTTSAPDASDERILPAPPYGATVIDDPRPIEPATPAYGAAPVMADAGAPKAPPAAKDAGPGKR